MTGNPAWKNDHSGIVYLGTAEFPTPFQDGRAHDLYFCLGRPLPSVMARYGNDKHCYISGVIDELAVFSYALKEAYRRAVDYGFIANSE